MWENSEHVLWRNSLSRLRRMCKLTVCFNRSSTTTGNALQEIPHTWADYSKDPNKKQGPQNLRHLTRRRLTAKSNLSRKVQGFYDKTRAFPVVNHSHALRLCLIGLSEPSRDFSLGGALKCVGRKEIATWKNISLFFQQTNKESKSSAFCSRCL